MKPENYGEKREIPPYNVQNPDSTPSVNIHLPNSIPEKINKLSPNNSLPSKDSKVTLSIREVEKEIFQLIGEELDKDIIGEEPCFSGSVQNRVTV